MFNNILYGSKYKRAASLLGMSEDELTKRIERPSKREAAQVLEVSPAQIAVAKQIAKRGMTQFCLDKLGIDEKQLEDLQQANRTNKGKAKEHEYVPNAETLGTFLRNVYAYFVKFKGRNRNAWKYKTEAGHLNKMTQLVEELVNSYEGELALQGEGNLSLKQAERRSKARVQLYMKICMTTFFAYYAHIFGSKSQLSLTKPKSDEHEGEV